METRLYLATWAKKLANFSRILQVVLSLCQKFWILFSQVDLDEMPLEKVLGDAADAGAAVEGSLIAGSTCHLLKQFKLEIKL